MCYAEINISKRSHIYFDDCVDTFEAMVNKLSVDWRQELRAECIQSVFDPNVESYDDASDLEEDVDDAMVIIQNQQ